MPIALTPPPQFTAAQPPAEVRIAPDFHEVPSSDLQSLVDQFRPQAENWAPPTRGLMQATVSPIFNSHFHHDNVTVNQVKSAVQKILASQEEGQGPISDLEGRGLSYEASSRLSAELKEAGFKAHFAEVDHNKSGFEISADGESVRGKSTGLVVVEGGKEPIFVDGAVRQWFADPEVRANMPSVFVGTAGDFQKLTAQHPEDLQLIVDSDPHTGQYQPSEFALYVLGQGGARQYLD